MELSGLRGEGRDQTRGLHRAGAEEKAGGHRPGHCGSGWTGLGEGRADGWLAGGGSGRQEGAG